MKKIDWRGAGRLVKAEPKGVATIVAIAAIILGHTAQGYAVRYAKKMWH